MLTSKSGLLLKILLLCVLPLLIGASVYVFFRQKGLLGLSWANPGNPGNDLGRILINTIPDFCWSFSLANALHLFGAYQQAGFWKTTRLAGLAVIVSEIVQLFFPFAFTFDLFDLFAAILAFALSFLYFKRNQI
jgi:hypothetical protein